MGDNYILLNEGGGTLRPTKAWVEGVPVEGAQKQLFNIASMTGVVGPHVTVMPDVHSGMGAIVGSVIPTVRAIIPSAVGVDIGCGMCAVRLNLRSGNLFDEICEDQDQNVWLMLASKIRPKTARPRDNSFFIISTQCRKNAQSEAESTSGRLHGRQPDRQNHYFLRHQRLDG